MDEWIYIYITLIRYKVTPRLYLTTKHKYCFDSRMCSNVCSYNKCR